MIQIICSKATKPSAELQEVPRKEGEDNLQWLAQHLRPSEDLSTIVLVGGVSPTSFRLRVAQSQVRHDLQPSSWSHALLLAKTAKNPAATPTVEISLEPPQGFAFPAPTNGLQRGKLNEYRSPEKYPNIAVLSVPASPKLVSDALEQYQKQRAILDGVDLLVRWLAYVWGVGRQGNPILDGFGMPSAAMLEIAFGVVGYDLTPGLESRSSCPEAIWQAAKWWQDYYKDQKAQPLAGAYFVGHRL